MPEWNAAYCLMKAKQAEEERIEKEKKIIIDVINGYASTGLMKCNIEIAIDIKKEIVNWLEGLGFTVKDARTGSGLQVSKVVTISWAETVEEEIPESDGNYSEGI